MTPVDERLRQELAEQIPLPEGTKDGWIFDGFRVTLIQPWLRRDIDKWYTALFRSYDQKEVMEYSACFKTLKLYELLGRKAERNFPLMWSDVIHHKAYKVGTDFLQEPFHETGQVESGEKYHPCVLGGVWFARDADRLEALKICGIDRDFQKKCATLRLGGA